LFWEKTEGKKPTLFWKKNVSNLCKFADVNHQQPKFAFAKKRICERKPVLFLAEDFI